jgi:DNA helicase TIP49 (TBP-interacting protein)
MVKYCEERVIGKSRSIWMSKLFKDAEIEQGDVIRIEVDVGKIVIKKVGKVKIEYDENGECNESSDKNLRV